MPNREIVQSEVIALIRMLKKTVSIFLTLFIMISIIPYLIPVPGNLFNTDDLATDASRFITVSGVNIHYQEYLLPDPAGTVVFVHGLGGSLFSFRNNIAPLLAEGLEVILIDLPGFGLSERTLAADYSNEGRARLLLQICEELSFYQPVHWVGHSMGGSILSWLPTLSLDRVASLTLIAAPFSNENQSHVASILRYYPPAVRYLRVGLPRFITKERVSSLLSAAYGRPLLDNEIDGYLKPLLIQNTHRTLVGLTRDRNGRNPDYGAITVPVLLLWGENDTWVPVSNADPWVDRLPASRLHIIPDAGHNPMETHVHEFNTIIVDYLRAQKHL